MDQPEWLPPPGAQLPPEVENQIAVMVAQAMQQLAPMYKPQPETDPMIQIEQMKVQQKEADSQLDSQTKLAEAQIKARSDAEDRASKERIAEMKMQTEALRTFGGPQ